MVMLVIAEHDNSQLAPATLAAITAALKIAEQLKLLVIGYQCQQVAQQAAQYQGVSEVIWVDHEAYQHFIAENAAEVIKQLASDYSHIIAAATTFGKNLLPRVAGLLEVAQISDVSEIIDAETFIRPIYAGNALEKVLALDTIKIITIRATAFELANLAAQPAMISQQTFTYEDKRVKFLYKHYTQSERPSLTAAKIVVAGGRGLQNAENFHLLEQLAQQLGAAIGASRAAVDAEFVPNDYQIGQTGKVIAPTLYIAIGISGAIQHLAGIKDSKIIVAINKDAQAPIFAVADYGLVADLFTVLPELQQQLTQLGYPLPN